MSTELPFDPRPLPGEVESVLRRVHRRRAARAGGSGAVVLAGVTVVALLLGGGGTQVLLQEDPVVPATGGSESPAPAVTAGPHVSATPAPVALGPASPTPGGVPPLGPAATPSPRPADQTPRTASPKPEAERPLYAGQLGPLYTRFEATDCVVTNRNGVGEPVVRNDYCFWFVGAGSKDSWRPYIRICRLYDSTTPGRLTFAGAEEADFALYRGRSSPNGPVTGELLFRFSDTVRYAGGAHGRDVSQGDCWTWRLQLSIDFEAYPADAGFVGEWRTYAEQVPAGERVQRSAFTAGGFHGDESP